MTSDNQHPPIWFPAWADTLKQLRLPPITHQQYRFALIQYLRFCKQSRQQATIGSAQEFIRTVEARRTLSVSMLQRWKDAINWFLTEGQKQPAGCSRVSARREFVVDRGTARSAVAATTTVVPAPAAADLGKTDWERKLIRVLRSRHYQWRTEQTYRGWGTRFAA